MSDILAIADTMTNGGCTPEAVLRLQNALLTMPQAEIVTEHIFKTGVYERRITIPPWTVLTGAEHRTPYRVRLERGMIAVNTDDGILTLTAPCEFDAPAGVQRVGRVFADEVVWVDIYDNPDDCRSIETLESRLYVVPDCGLGENRMRLESDRRDFALFLAQMGVTQPDMDAVVQIESDMITMPEGVGVELRESKIHGMGLFATRDFEVGEVLCPGRLDGMRTPAGRFINHSKNPNIKPVKSNDDIHAVAVKFIAKGDEVFVNYRDSMRVNFGIDLPEGMLCQVG